MRVKRCLLASVSSSQEDGSEARPAQGFLASLIDRGSACDEHPVTVTIRELTSSLFNQLQKMLMVRNVTLEENYLSILLLGTHSEEGLTLSQAVSISQGRHRPRKGHSFPAECDEIILLPLLLNNPGCQQICPQGGFVTCPNPISNRQVGQSKGLTFSRV